MTPLRPKSAVSGSVCGIESGGTGPGRRPQTSLFRLSRSETNLVAPIITDNSRSTPTPTPAAAAAAGRGGSRLNHSQSTQLHRHCSSAKHRRLISCLKDEFSGRSNSVSFIPQHQIHDRRFYRCNRENIWNNIWRVPQSRRQYLTPFVANQYAIDSIDDKFHHQDTNDKDEERLRHERHDQILSQFRVQRLRNAKRDLQCRYPITCVAGRRPPLMIRSNQVQSEAARHQQQICDRLSRPRHRRNRPDLSSSDMIEYRGLIVGHDIEYFYTDQYDVDNASLAYAHDLYKSMLISDHDSNNHTRKEIVNEEVTEGRSPRIRLLRVQSSGSIERIAYETRCQLDEFETRLMIGRRD